MNDLIWRKNVSNLPIMLVNIRNRRFLKMEPWICRHGFKESVAQPWPRSTKSSSICGVSWCIVTRFLYCQSETLLEFCGYVLWIWQMYSKQKPNSSNNTQPNIDELAQKFRLLLLCVALRWLVICVSHSYLTKNNNKYLLCRKWHGILK